VFVGEPVEVVRKPIEYEIKTNGENDPMKELIINALQAAVSRLKASPMPS
jgi:hypothetical protein